MKTDTLAMEVLPSLGGKISSLQWRGLELLQQPLRAYEPRTMRMGFEDSDASGIDECLPSVSACEAAGFSIPDHGEFWRLPCDVEQRGDKEVRLTATGKVLPLRFERRLTLEGDGLRIEYRVENVGEVEIPYAWSAHPLFAVDAGDLIELPPSVREVMVESSARGRLGARGTVLRWPIAEPRGGMKDLSRAGRVSDDKGDKLYATAPVEGWAAVVRRKARIRVRVEYDPALTPYLGLWLCYGGWPQGAAARQQCVALEPCTSPDDSLAEAMAAGRGRVLAPGQSALWWMAIQVNEVL